MSSLLVRLLHVKDKRTWRANKQAERLSAILRDYACQNGWWREGGKEGRGGEGRGGGEGGEEGRGREEGAHYLQHTLLIKNLSVFSPGSMPQPPPMW